MQDLNGRLRELVGELVHLGVTLDQGRKEFEKIFITATLKLHQGNITRSAEHLGVHRNTLRNKVSTLGILESDYRPRSAGRR